MTDRVRTRALSPAVPAAIALAWVLAVAAQVSGRPELLNHDAFFEVFVVHGSYSVWAGLILFLLAWQAMVVAMMLPSSLPLVRLFAVAVRSQDRPGAVQAVFIGGYVFVWGAFGMLALSGDLLVHRIVEHLAWLDARPHLVSGAILATAGLFQFSSLKERCLSKCRHPAAYLMRNYRTGLKEAFRLGSGHGLFCLGCCWALMLLMFAIGTANLVWMALLAGVMTYEKVGRHGRSFVPLAGMLLLSWAAIVFVQPAWLPSVLAGLN